MRTYRFNTSHYISYGYVDIEATSERKAVALFKEWYDHLLINGRLHRRPSIVG